MRIINLSCLVLVAASQISFGALQISRQPQYQIVWIGGQASFTVVAKGAKNISYQWQKDGEDLPGETKSTLRIKQTTANDRGFYSVRVSGGSGTVFSEKAALLSMESYAQVTEDFSNPDSGMGLLGDGDYGSLSPEISSEKLRFQYSSGITQEEDAAYWWWNRSPQRNQGFDIRIDGNDSTNGKLQFVAACYPTGLSYRIERNGREGNFNAGSLGDNGQAVKRSYYNTSSMQFSFRLVYDAFSKVRTLKAYYDEDGSLNGENWTLLQTVKNPNFTKGKPILIGVIYNNNNNNDGTGEDLDGNNVTADNFEAR